MATASNKRSTNQKQELKSLLECSICLEPFDNPRTLLCLHSFCKNCLENFVKEKSLDDLNCPVCRAKFTLNEGGVAAMTKNHFICNMVEVMSIQDEGKCVPCTHCQEPSVGRCVTCELFMCEKCLQSHNGYVGFRDHVVLTMEELSKPENQSKIKNRSKCHQHPQKKLKYYCETCNELICRHCFDFDHNKQHKFAPLEKAAKSKREELRKDCETLERIVNKRNKETQDLTVVRQSLNSNFDKAQLIINEEKTKLLDTLQHKLEKKTNLMIKQVRQVYDQKTELVNAKINEGEAFVKRVKASSDLAHSLLQNANDEEIVHSYHSVQENVENALEENEDLYADGDDVMSWSPDRIKLMLVAEIKDIVQDEGSLNVSPADLGQGPTHDVLREEIKIIPGKSPHQIRNRAIREIESGAELPPFEVGAPKDISPAQEQGCGRSISTSLPVSPLYHHPAVYQYDESQRQNDPQSISRTTIQQQKVPLTRLLTPSCRALISVKHTDEDFSDAVKKKNTKKKKKSSAD